MHKLTCLLLSAMPLASRAHTGAGSDASLLHSLQHGGEILPLLLAIIVAGGWLLHRLGGRS